jgi:hypothetical protein
MKRLMSAAAIVCAVTAPALAESWVRVDANLWLDSESLFTDSGGYTLFKTKQTDPKGATQFQHKEAIHCGNAKHFFRGMYDATASVNNKDDADVKWADWKTNPREAYNIDRLYALKTTVCKLKR